MKIFVLGGVSMDTIIHLDKLPNEVSDNLFAKKQFKTIGSTGIGKAIPLSSLGFDVVFHGLIGNDEDGKNIQKEIAKTNIKFLYDVDPKGTETHTNLMDSDGNRISIYTNSCSLEPDINKEAIIEEIKSSDVIIMNIINYTRELIPIVKQYHKPLWIDIHDYDEGNQYHQDYIDAADFLFLSKDKLINADAFAKKMLEQKKQLVAITDGKNGAALYYPDGHVIIQHAKLSNHVVDTNGAGDHFMSGYLFGYLNHLSDRESSYLAAMLAKSCVESETISNPKISKDWLLSLLK